MIGLLASMACASVTAQRQPAPVHGFKVVATFPHDPSAFTQGLVFADGEFYESTGLNGESSLRRVEIATGKVLQQIKVDSEYFAEGLALVGDELLQLTWQHQRGFVYDRKTFDAEADLPLQGRRLGHRLRRRRRPRDERRLRHAHLPRSEDASAATRTLRVRDAGRPVPQLNELEWVEGEIWANVWMTDRIARISPATGEVNAWIDLSTLWPRSQRQPPADVLNGIAYDKATRRIFVTGKKWPRLYQIAVQ